MNKGGERKEANREWHRSNGSYPVSCGLGVIIMSIGVLIAIYPIRPELSAAGSALLVLMALSTLSFLITTPEAWAPALGDANQGFPFLSGMGRLVIKDSIMLGAAFLTMTDAARESLRRCSSPLMPKMLSEHTPSCSKSSSVFKCGLSPNSNQNLGVPNRIADVAGSAKAIPASSANAALNGFSQG